ncbi:hypothetical protein [Streptomyces griseorubiginosus]|uniref:hypothetical protein n=1 Tax=Streptomyces griseorubiginosus TaxID=67304 RepID=UPI000AA6698B|nr:hypothetical protein [Streptomyces griseorubiginosus]
MSSNEQSSEPNNEPTHPVSYDLNYGDHPAPIPFTAPWVYEIHLPCDPRGPRIVRGTLRAVLHAHGIGELADKAELLTCELATTRCGAPRARSSSGCTGCARRCE